MGKFYCPERYLALWQSHWETIESDIITYKRGPIFEILLKSEEIFIFLLWLIIKAMFYWIIFHIEPIKYIRAIYDQSPRILKLLKIFLQLED